MKYQLFEIYYDEIVDFRGFINSPKCELIGEYKTVAGAKRAGTIHTKKYLHNGLLICDNEYVLFALGGNEFTEEYKRGWQEAHQV